VRVKVLCRHLLWANINIPASHGSYPKLNNPKLNGIDLSPPKNWSQSGEV
jgi:hypothetical protein